MLYIALVKGFVKIVYLTQFEDDEINLLRTTMSLDAQSRSSWSRSFTSAAYEAPGRSLDDHLLSSSFTAYLRMVMHQAPFLATQV